MTFHKEGKNTLLVGLAFSAALLALVWNFSETGSWLRTLTVVFCIFLLAIIIQFFRKPTRHAAINPKHILAPADGKVVVIEEVEETEYFKDKRIQVSIFMSPLNVHMNFNPIDGLVKLFKYHPGKYLVAWHPKSSTENERTTFVVQHENGSELLFRQIAGALARRICWYVKEGDKVKQGSEFGFIKFGSRVDVFLPLGTKVLCNLGDKPIGGETVIAEFV